MKLSHNIPFLLFVCYHIDTYSHRFFLEDRLEVIKNKCYQNILTIKVLRE